MSTKMDISWHYECLKNSKATAERLRQEILRLQGNLDRLGKNNQFYTLQIETAVKEKKTAFDRDRYLVKRKTK